MIRSIENGRKEDGNRSIADKIIKRLHDLEKTVQHNHGRWAWELLQNAKDSVAETNRMVSVRIIHKHDEIEFSHNGNHFTEKDIRGIINQISSKEVDEGEVSKRTGRFGTGFLTTHLLSREVYIEGIVETDNGALYTFGFPLNRNGKTTSVLIPKIEAAWSSFHESTENGKIDDYDEEDFNTSFTYSLDTKGQQEIAQIGVDEFSDLIPYVLSFIPEIHSVEIIDKVEKTSVIFTNNSKIVDGFKKITKTQDGKLTVIRILFATNEMVSIAARVIKKSDIFEFQSLEQVPKLFCDFPLIGTEDFHFPIVVNSFFFNPQTERDGVWLKGDYDSEVNENKKILEQALVLYKDLVAKLRCASYKNIFHIVNSKIPYTDENYFDKDWYIKTIQKPLRDFLLKQEIVETEGETSNKLGESWFPRRQYNKLVRESLWQYTFDMFPNSVCKKESIHDWIDVIWDDISVITFAEIANDIAQRKTITKLAEDLQMDESGTFEWLNEVGQFIMEEEFNLPLFEKHAIIPNQNGTFLIKSKLYLDEVNDSDLLEILRLLGEDWDNILLHKKITFGKFFSKKKSEIALKINEKLKNPRTRDQDFKKSISILSEWFDNNSDEGKEFFSETYRKRAELFMNTIEDKESLYKVMRSKTDLSKVAEAIEANPSLFETIEKAEEIYLLLEKYNVKSLDQLRELLVKKSTGSSGDHTLLPVTQEILANMGIISLKEWQEAIKDKDLAAIYSHNSTPTTDMFVYVQSLISKAKKCIIAHLETLDNYNLDNLDDTTAPTILAGILKDEKEISIVARPAYNKEVIIYYGSERDILDYEPSELWVDDGVQPKMISLGHLLKKANIVKFPI
ncbi:sacsin N-terminal ATP-binding-like domain-containing protein [Algoriphagus terrigena]|uniref:sacsin N-terminal ATP-binding-like domain-containing protein n=1 Tax=Algoriphagus terrigena TaxID=344884 RepID=UPI000429F295|nr:hypothetical protein [Algoriphagus terrigena]